MPVIDHDPLDDLERPARLPEGKKPRELLMMDVAGELSLTHTQRRTLIALLPFYHPKLAVTVETNGESFAVAMEQIWNRTQANRRPQVLPVSPVTPVCSAVEPEGLDPQAEAPERIRRRI